MDHPPANEDTPIQPADYYQRTKYEAEPLVLQMASPEMETVILRPAAIYGARVLCVVTSEEPLECQRLKLVPQRRSQPGKSARRCPRSRAAQVTDS